MTVTCGLAFVLLAMTPTYCATKAAIYSYTAVAAVSTERHRHSGSGTRTSVRGDNLDGRAPGRQPSATEILVGRVLPLRCAEQGGQEKYAEFFKHFNDAITAALQQTPEMMNHAKQTKA